jgi:hypothetical protein
VGPECFIRCILVVCDWRASRAITVLVNLQPCLTHSADVCKLATSDTGRAQDQQRANKNVLDEGLRGAWTGVVDRVAVEPSVTFSYLRQFCPRPITQHAHC